jgi:hypothetical protein
MLCISQDEDTIELLVSSPLIGSPNTNSNPTVSSKQSSPPEGDRGPSIRFCGHHRTCMSVY